LLLPCRQIPTSKCSLVQWTKPRDASRSCFPCGLLAGPLMLRSCLESLVHCPEFLSW
jgi:hypothetical protein